MVWAAEHRRRSLLVGPLTVATVLGGALAPRLLDLFLGRTNDRAQQVDEPEDPHRPDYLDAPVPGDHGTHGPFDDEALRHSTLLTIATHRAETVALLAAAGAAWRAWQRRG